MLITGSLENGGFTNITELITSGIDLYKRIEIEVQQLEWKGRVNTVKRGGT